MEDDGPNKAQRQLWIAIDDIFRADVDQLDLLVPQKVQRHLSVLQHVETHFTLLSWLRDETRDELKPGPHIKSHDLR